jgi:hypothetical protein
MNNPETRGKSPVSLDYSFLIAPQFSPCLWIVHSSLSLNFPVSLDCSIDRGKKEGAIKNEQSRDTGKIKGQSRMNNPETRGKLRGNQE